MKRFFLVLLAVSACQSKAEETPTPPPVVAAAPAAPASDDQRYAEDIRLLCDSMALSGADKLQKLERVAPHSKWLGENLKTKAVQQFLVKTGPLKGEERAAAYEAEAQRVGLPGCALAAEFR